jgi:hypothetical protein
VNAAGQTIGLCMIVKDEAEVLPRLFASCRDLIDHWVVSDTGSTDGTQDIVRSELEGIPGELHERPWVDFGANRTELMELARGTADYLLLLDADMTLVQTAPLGSLRADAYLVRHAAPDVEYRVERLVRGDLAWRFVGATHEYLEPPHENASVEPLDALVVEHHADGDSWSHKFERDLALLTAALDREPDEPRTLFYLAQTLRDLGRETGNKHMLANAASHYARRAELEGWEEEVYVARYQAGVLYDELGRWPEAMDAYAHAWELRPQRLEAVHALTAGLRERGCHHTAHRLARMAGNLRPLPAPPDLLFVEPWIYEWGMLFEYSITSYWVGEHANAIAACRRLLQIASLPEEHRAQTERNLGHALRAAARAAAEKPPRRRTIRAPGTPS